MKSVLNFVDEVYSLIRKPEIVALLDGGAIYKYTRPDNSRKVDIVVNSLPASGDQLQDSSVNVNIHVPNLVLDIENNIDNSQPNQLKIKEVSEALIPLLKDSYVNGSDIVIQSTMLMLEQQFNEHFLNIRLQIYSPNIN